MPDPYITHEYHNIATTLQIPTLNSFRTFKEVIFLLKLFNGQIDCPYLSSKLNLRVSMVNTRNRAVFSLLKFSSSYTENEPINRICNCVNDNDIDIFETNVTRFIRVNKNILLDYD